MHTKGKKISSLQRSMSRSWGGRGSLCQASGFEEREMVPPVCRVIKGSGTQASKPAKFIFTVSHVEGLCLDTAPGERAETWCHWEGRARGPVWAVREAQLGHGCPVPGVTRRERFSSHASRLGWFFCKVVLHQGKPSFTLAALPRTEPQRRWHLRCPAPRGGTVTQAACSGMQPAVRRRLSGP